MLGTRIGTHVMLACAALAGLATRAVDAVVPSAHKQTARKQQHRGTSQMGSPVFGKRGPGLSNAKVQRMARKRRNVQRNRSAHRKQRGFSTMETLIGIVCVAVWLAFLGSIADKATAWAPNPDSGAELRCVYGYRFIAAPDGTLTQLVDESGLGVHCAGPLS